MKDKLLSKDAARKRDLSAEMNNPGPAAGELWMSYHRGELEGRPKVGIFCELLILLRRCELLDRRAGRPNYRHITPFDEAAVFLVFSKDDLTARARANKWQMPIEDIIREARERLPYELEPWAREVLDANG